MKRVMRIVMAISGFATGMVALAGAAFAQTASDLDGVTTSANATKSAAVSWIGSVGLPILFGLLLLGIGIKLATKFVKRGVRSA